jgi:ATP synthase protein I
MAGERNDGGGWGKGLNFGLEIAAGIGLGTLIGFWLDKRFGSKPWCLLVGLLLGCASGMYLLLKDINRMNKD